jgi:iron complex outermembrane receptor protein
LTNSDSRHKATLWLGPIAISAQLLCSVSALAQETESIRLGNVVLEGSQTASPIDEGDGYTAQSSITGIKSGALLTEVPQSISVVTQREIEDRGVTQLEDAVAYTAGVTSSIWGIDDRYDQFLLRGFDIGTSSVFRDSLNQKALDFSGFKIDPFMVQRIDVLRGPAGVLYGENDAGGMINVITKRPKDEAERKLMVSYGSNNVARVGLDLTGPVGNQSNLSYRVIALAQSGEGEVDNSENDRLLFAPSLTWRPDNDTRITFLAQWQKDRLTPNAFFPVAGEDYPLSSGKLPTSFTNSQHDFNRLHTTQKSVGYEFERRLASNLTLRQNFRYSVQDTDYRHIYHSAIIDDTTMEFDAFTVDETAKQARLDTQLQYDLTSSTAKTTLVAGVDISRDEIDGSNGWDGSYRISITDPSYDFDVSMPAIYYSRKQVIDSKALYAQGLTRFDSGLGLTYGVRKAWIDSKLTDYLNNNAVTEGDNDAFTKMFGVTWDLGQGWVPYASYTEGFTTNIGSDVNDEPFVPTESKQYEIGVKFAPTDNSLYTLAVFDLRKENVLTSALDDNNPYGQIQTGEVRHRGVELEARTRFKNGISLIGSYTYLDAEITESNDGVEGNRPSLVPEHQISLWVDYALGKAMPGSRLAGLSLGGGARYIGKTWGDNANTREIDSYTIADLALRYEFDDYSIGLNVSNLFDEEYYATCTARGTSGCILGAGRNISLSLNRSF